MAFIFTAREVHRLLSSTADWDVEQVWVLALNSQLQLIDFKMISIGTVDACLLHPRDIFRFIYLKNASGFILAHNHPSGQSEPSDEDLALTKKFLKLSWLHEVPMHDHVILTRDGGRGLRGHKQIRVWNRLKF